ncbi:MAG: UDP-N-acetylmuramoyl-tripeptide--D-alanyl-D-alanine ligase [Deltaproteobacteria bacterium]|nr:UDP-N-acetylmuramoyl-tripeptide--D-alanyl-D-alanine ligase [Deltaproteobacteria bacterium]
MKLTVNDIVGATNGRLLRGDGQPAIHDGQPAGLAGDSEVKGVSIDSRTIKPGHVFFALRGVRFDGHAFIPDVERMGAACAVVEERYWKEGSVSPDFRIIGVKDTRASLGDLASFIRRRRRIPLVAVGGTSGKTTTKEMIASILARSMTVLKTSGNMNNLVGVPLTLVSLNNVHDAAVVELGISEPGEMRRLSRICAPDVAVITNVGRAHLEKLGSMEKIAEEKTELYASLAENGVRVVNLDDPLVVRFTEGHKTEKVTFSRKKDADVCIKEFSFAAGEANAVTVLYGVRGTELRARINSPLLSNIYNGAAAIATVLPLGVAAEDIRQGLDSFVPPGGRMEILKVGAWTVLNDTYNANPDSTLAALKTLASMNGRKVTVIGSMLELGSGSEEAHAEAGRLAATLGVDVLVTVGRWREAVRDGALSGGMKEKNVFGFDDNAETASEIKRILKDGDIVLVKGSRAARMEEIVEALKGLNGMNGV